MDTNVEIKSTYKYLLIYAKKKHWNVKQKPKWLSMDRGRKEWTGRDNDESKTSLSITYYKALV